MTNTFTKHHLVIGEKVYNTVDYILSQGLVGVKSISKSSSTQTSQFFILIKTFDTMNSYKTYSFSLNELEAEFSAQDNELKAIILRDTEVNKKITFKKDAAELTYVRGQDTLGVHSESNSMVTREPVFWIKINGNTFHAPFDIVNVYETITNTSVEDITQAEVEQEMISVNVWEEFKLKLQEENENG